MKGSALRAPQLDGAVREPATAIVYPPSVAAAAAETADRLTAGYGLGAERLAVRPSPYWKMTMSAATIRMSTMMTPMTTFRLSRLAFARASGLGGWDRGGPGGSDR